MKRRIAIIGGGISGLSAAYYLVTRVPPEDCEILVFEKSATLGGNSATMEVGTAEGWSRWVDMGVNDFNARSYGRMMTAMHEIGFEGYAPLEDGACFFRADGSVLHTIGDPVGPAALEGPVEAMNARFMAFALQRSRDPFTRRPEYSVGDAVAAFAEDLSKEEARHFARVVRELLFPRISAMYFTDDRGPANMSLLGVMDYYRLQEGVDEAPARMSFTAGATAFVEALATWLRARGVKILTGFDTTVHPRATGAQVHSRSGQIHLPGGGYFDDAIITCHAEDALDIVDCSTLGPTLPRILGQVSHSTAVAVAHTDASLLPRDRRSWRTYNVPVRSGPGPSPYSITYVVNQHQNDARRRRDVVGQDFFITLNPTREIAEGCVLRQAGPESREAVHWFRHNVLDADGLKAQAALRNWHMSDGLVAPEASLFFAGGWTNGAGLHEQCFEQSDFVVDRVLQRKATFELQARRKRA